MPTRTSTCTEKAKNSDTPCGGEIRASYIGPAPIIGALAQKGDVTFPAACQTCGKTYADVVSVPLTQAEIDLVGQRLSESTRQELLTTTTELAPGSFGVELTEERARDLASKAANLGLLVIAKKIRQELDGLTTQRRQP
jgi:hypothetical protein